MDEKKRLIIVILFSAGAFALWLWGQNVLRHRHPEWFEPAKPAATATNEPEKEPGTQPTTQWAASGGRAGGPTMTARPAGGPGGARVAGAKAAEPATLGQTQFVGKRQTPTYNMGLAIDPQGAALEAVVLNRFRAQVGVNEPYVFQTPYPEGKPELSRALATRSITVNGVTHDLAGVLWSRKAATADSATYSIDILGFYGKPLLTVNKTYQLTPSNDPKTLGYEIHILYSFENRSAELARVQLTFNGPNVPRVENTRDVPEVVVGYNDDRQVSLIHHPASGYSPDKPPMDLKSKDKLPLLWAGMSSTYWDAIVRPEINAQGQAPMLADVTAQAVAKRDDATGQDFVTLSFETAELNVPAGGRLAAPFYVYFGPRQREILYSSHYADFPLAYDRTLVLTSGVCAYCTFQWLINVLVWMLGIFHWVFGGFAGHGDWGLAIIALVIVVRLLLHPITKRSQISMSKMSKMAPEMERLKKKYGDNKEELNRAMMEFYKEQGFGAVPIMGCLPMLLQMPIWIALWQALQGTFDLRQAPFLWGFTWIKDLAAPDHLIKLAQPISIWFLHIDGLNLLPILMGAVMYAQTKLTPQPPSTTPEQEQQKTMMLWMSTLLFPLMLYSGPSGLNLYILTSTAIGIWESKRVRDHLKAQEEAERAGKVIVDAPSTRASRKHARDERAEPQAKKGGIAGWLENIQKMAEDVKKDKK